MRDRRPRQEALNTRLSKPPFGWCNSAWWSRTTSRAGMSLMSFTQVIVFPRWATLNGTRNLRKGYGGMPKFGHRHSESSSPQSCNLAAGSCPAMCTCSNNIVDCRGKGLTAIPANLPDNMAEM
ncbi:hypothetical protein NFI96_003807 [Prochilodus magdalenae]|nr:hypothetical protein NFI96_003807 [Prochilodus magdalenae]